MQAAPDAPAFLYSQAWIGLRIIVVAYYVGLFVIFRARTRRPIGVTQYEPPKGISPAVVANLSESEAYERAFASALVSLCQRLAVRFPALSTVYVVLVDNTSGQLVQDTETRATVHGDFRIIE